MPLFCGEDLNFGGFSKFFPPGEFHFFFILYLLTTITNNGELSNYVPGRKNFENALKFKSSPQHNGISAAVLKQMLCGDSMNNKCLSKFNLKVYIAK
jgi:hypothetical protein